MHTNFDASCDPGRIEAAALAADDRQVSFPHRRYARLWLASDFAAAVTRSERSAAAGLSAEISAAYSQSAGRDDVESPESVSKEDRLPSDGILVHSEYTLYGHFFHLRALLRNVDKVRFFLDQDSGMRAACLGAFADRVKSRRCDAFYIRIAKELTIDEKRHRLRDAEKEFMAQADLHQTLRAEEIKLLLLKARIAGAQAAGQWNDRWVQHPLPSMSEPEKSMCYLTDYGDYDPDHLAWLYNKASLHAVDSWFNRLRRRSSMLERSVASQGNRGRVWNGYLACRPGQLQKLMTIYRACHNYIWLADGQNQMPAMRLGLAKAPLDYKDIIYFSDG